MMNESDNPGSSELSSPLDRLIAKSKQTHGNENADKPHPLIVAERWGFNLSYVDFDGDPQHYLYHAVQWTQGLGASRHTVWQNIKKQIVIRNDNLRIEILPYIATDGKTYQVDFISQETCYHVAQNMRVTKKNPQLGEIQDYLAKSGVIIDWVRYNDEWLKTRLKGVKVRKKATEIYTETHVIHKPNIPALTNATYHYLFGTKEQKTAKKELVKVLGLTPTEANHFRDHLHRLALIAIDSAEALATEKMYLLGYPLTDDEQLEIVAQAARMEAESYIKKCDWLKIDRITGESFARLTS